MKLARSPFVVTAVVLLFLYLPIIVLVINSFNESRFGGIWTGFSGKWYELLFTQKEVWNALKNSLIVGSIATIISTCLGTIAAIVLYKYKTRLQKTHYALLYAPLIIPDILMGVSLLVFFVSLSFPLGIVTVCIAHTTFCISYITMIVRARLQHFEYAQVEAAYDLGATSWTVLHKIIIPHLRPAIAAGALLAFTISLDDFVITFFVVGPGFTTLPIYVYSMIKFGSPPIINALSTILLGITFIIIAISYSLTEEKP